MVARPDVGIDTISNVVGMRFRCPDGCGVDVTLHFGKPTDGRYTWDGDVDAPSVTESITVPTCGWRGYLRGEWLTEFESAASEW